MSHILIAYASSYGQTHKIAEVLAAELGRAGHTVELSSLRDDKPPPVQRYDAVVLGSSVERGRHARRLVDYIRANRVPLSGAPSYFFSVSMAAASSRSSDPQGYLEKLFATTEWTPREAVAFAGALPYRKYNWFLRFIMKRISGRNGLTTDTSRDHEFTDWTRVKQFAVTIAADLTAPRRDRPGEHAHV